MKKITAFLLVSVLALACLSGCKAVPGKTAETAAAAETTAAPSSAAAAAQTQTQAAATAAPAQTQTQAVTTAASEAETRPAAKEEITIVYTNDVHSYVYNTVTDKDKNKHPGLRLSSVAALKKDLAAQGKNVLLVDAGDEIQGNIFGSIDKGETIIRIMNSAGYDLACPGNHEFDYGMVNFFDRVGQALYPFVSCTLKNVKDGSLVLEPHKIFDLNGTKVAFVGISTPETLTSTARTIFQDADRNQLYTFSGLNDAPALYADIQAAVDMVRDQADYVIALGHAGIDASAQIAGISSKDIIAHTEGIDAFIDGHSHTVMECELIKDKNGKEVPLTQTGCYLTNIGIMTLSPDGKITTSLVSEYSGTDDATAKLEEQFNTYVEEKTGTKLAESDFQLSAFDPEKPEVRLIRTMETNLGDFITDAYYWYLNVVNGTDCDVVINNGGGLRTNIEKGDIRYVDVRNVVPYSNTVCMIKVTGAQLKDILENGAVNTGVWDPVLNIPAEQGSFMHVAGIRFTIDASVPSSVEYDGDVFKKVSGEYKVRDLQIYNKETCAYEDVDPEGVYNLGGIDYLLRNGGSGLGFLQDNECVISYAGPEVELVNEYLTNFKKEGEYPKISTENSPLASWKGYLLKYEDTYGAGRISIINVNYK